MMPLIFTTELTLDHQHLDDLESWCHGYLTSPWKLDSLDDPESIIHELMGWPACYVLRVSTPEDHALVQLTWL